MCSFGIYKTFVSSDSTTEKISVANVGLQRGRLSILFEDTENSSLDR